MNLWNSWYMENCINDVQRFVRKLQKVNTTKQQRETLRGQRVDYATTSCEIEDLKEQDDLVK